MEKNQSGLLSFLRHADLNYPVTYYNNHHINSTSEVLTFHRTNATSALISLKSTTTISPISSYASGGASDMQYSPILSTAEQIGDYLTLYYLPILVLAGSIGNILSCFVFFKTKLKKLSSSYYLAALAVSDTCFLFGLFVQWLNLVDIDIYNREIFCQFLTFFSSLCSFLSVWFVVAFTVERFIAVMYPLKRQSMCTVKRAKIVLCGLILIGSLHCTPFIFFASPRYDTKINATLCDIRPEYKHYMVIINYIDTVVVFVVPFTTIVVLNTFTGCTVWKFATVRRAMTMQKRQSQITRTTFAKSTKVHIRKQLTFSNSSYTSETNDGSIRSQTKSNGRRKIGNSSQIKVTKMLLIVSTVFVCLNLPSYVMRVRAFLEIEVSKTTIVVQYICWFFFLTNFGINFILYCVSGQNFRKAVISVFRKLSSSRQRDGTTQVTVSEYLRNSGTTSSRRRAIVNESWSDVHELRHFT